MKLWLAPSKQWQGHTQTKAGLQMLQDCYHQTTQSSIGLPRRAICKVNRCYETKTNVRCLQSQLFHQSEMKQAHLCLSAYIHLVLLWETLKRSCRHPSLAVTYVVGRGVGFNRPSPTIRSLTSIFCISVVLPLTKASNPPASLNWNWEFSHTLVET